MSDLRELYQTVILDHSKSPRNFREPAGANRQADGVNPLCGDKVTIYVEVKDDVVQDIGFSGSGCAISTASASLMTEAVKGRSVEYALRLFEDFHGMVTCDAGPEAEAKDIGKLTVFGGVREFPVRVKCATLAWHTLTSALSGTGEIATTE